MFVCDIIIYPVVTCCILNKLTKAVVATINLETNGNKRKFRFTRFFYNRKYKYSDMKLYKI